MFKRQWLITGNVSVYFTVNRWWMQKEGEECEGQIYKGKKDGWRKRMSGSPDPVPVSKLSKTPSRHEDFVFALSPLMCCFSPSSYQAHLPTLSASASHSALPLLMGPRSAIPCALPLADCGTDCILREAPLTVRPWTGEGKRASLLTLVTPRRLPMLPIGRATTASATYVIYTFL